jgi:hypothetical protein
MSYTKQELEESIKVLTYPGDHIKLYKDELTYSAKLIRAFEIAIELMNATNNNTNANEPIVIRHKINDKYICDITNKLDKLANMNDDDSYLKHYILVDKSCIKDRVLPIRVPGCTVGGLWFDENYCITKIHIDSKVGYATKPYPENVNELMQKYIGRFLAIENMEEKNNDK